MAKPSRPTVEHWKVGPADPDDECLSVEEILFRLREAFPQFEEDADLGRRKQQEKVDRLRQMGAPAIVVDHEAAAVERAVYVVVSDPSVNEQPLDFIVRDDEDLDVFPEMGKHVLLRRLAEALDYGHEEM